MSSFRTKSIQMANSTTIGNMKATMYFDCTQLNDDIFLCKYSNGKTDSISIGNIRNIGINQFIKESTPYRQ